MTKIFEPIAVVGQSCVLPGALNPQELWTAIAAGRDLVSSVPEGRWGLAEHLALTGSTRDATDRTWCDRGGYVRGFDAIFDPSGFGLPEEEILALDPLFQWVLHTGRAALRSAQLDPTALRTGAILGNLSYPAALSNRFAETTWLSRQDFDLPGNGERERLHPRNRFNSGLPAHLLARALGLTAGAFALDDACASSLYAVKLACDRLHDRRADAMLAGAVSSADDLFIHIGFCALEAMSPSGRSRPFHRDADGLLPAEGAAFVVLKRLDDAVAQGDEILGVIHGVGLSNDGRGRGLLAPSEDGQVRAIRQAYEAAGWRPADVSLVECHATGTPVGDATEIRSLSRVYEGLQDVPIGSFKSNSGHLITAAGLAGLLKILGAMKAEVRPPTLHVDDPHPVLEGSPFRLLREGEPWTVDGGPRRAALSAFGFGGNNAHLLVEEWTRSSSSVSPTLPRENEESRIAVVGLAVIAADGTDVTDFAHTVLSRESRLQERPNAGPAGLAKPIEMALQGLRFPPRDLEQTLPQQLLLLKAARQVVDPKLKTLPRERTGVLIGMQCDPEVARYGMRWRLADWGEAWGAGADWTHDARDAVIDGLRAAGVVGAMPNMPANRLNSQFDLGGPSATFSSEELSGIVALELAARALRAGEMDAAVVGAVDLSCEPVHEAAAREVLGENRQTPGDAAVVLVLRRLEDARSLGENVLAVLTEDGDDEALRFGPDEAISLTPLVGHAHAASGLLHVAAAVMACHHRARPPAAIPTQGAVPWISGSPRRVDVPVTALEGQRATVHVVEDRDSRPGCLAPEGFPRVHLFAGADRAGVLERLRDGEPGTGPVRLALVARDDDELAARRHAATSFLKGERPMAGRGVHYREAPVDGELAFVFHGAAAAYADMGRDLVLAMPELMDHFGRRMRDPGAARWAYDPEHGEPHPLDQLWGSCFLCQVHAELSRHVLGLAPDAAIGCSSGESNALMALGVWTDLDDFFRESVDCDLFTKELVGEFRAAGRHWQETGEVRYENWVLNASADMVREALASEERVYLTLVNSPDEVVIGGAVDACRRLIDRLGVTVHPLGYPMVAHSPVIGEVSEEWLELHRRQTSEVRDIRFYTHADGGRSYTPDRESAARAILSQALTTADFPAVVKRAWDDGVRVFLEHGPGGLSSRWIKKTLKYHGVADDAYLAVSYDRRGASLEQTADAVAALLAAGVDVDHEAFNERPVMAGAAPRAEGPVLTFAAHWPEVRLSPLPTAEWKTQPEVDLAALLKVETVMTELGETQIMAPAPPLVPVLEEVDEPEAVPSPVVAPAPAPVAAPTPAPVTAPAPPPVAPAPVAVPAPIAAVPAPASATPGVWADMNALQAQLAAAQKDYVTSQNAVHQQFLALRQRTMGLLLDASRGQVPASGVGQAASASGVGQAAPASGVGQAAPAIPAPQAPVAIPSVPGTTSETPRPSGPRSAGAACPTEAPGTATPVPGTATPVPGTATPVPGTATPVPGTEGKADPGAPTPTGPQYSRQDLEVLASGKISSIFGPLFERQDGYHRQVRMPEPPFLLADRVTGIDAEPGSMGTGTIWTETDVKEDSWYLYRGHMPGGLMIEAGQADLLLISWLGVDFLNKSERVYRLLGCELTYRAPESSTPLPMPGDTLCYDIHIDGHAKQGDVRLFFFHYDCRIDGDVRLQVRHGQAGFFTDEELADSAGVLWDPADVELPPAEHLDPPAVRCTRRSFDHRQMIDFSEGRIWECLGPGYEWIAAHTQPPGIQSGRMMLLHEVTDFDPEGGPWGRGYLRARTPILSEDWVFEGHFKNDLCMPGTVMFEGCLQTMAFYLTAMGYTLERDGWRFEPVPDLPYPMRCRGQVIPSSQELVYELFVHEVIAGPVPTLYADLLCTVDGLKAFHAERVGLRLVPSWPLEVAGSEQQRYLTTQTTLSEPGEGESPVATVDDFAFDYASLLACAWGRPTKAFGEMYRPFDGPRGVARLPGPPYHFMTRVCQIDGEMGRFQSGAVIETEYDVPKDAWYFSENGYPTMPYAVLMEAGLQPCGWLASFVGSALTTDIDLQFRNLDGTGTFLSEVLPNAGTLRNRVKLEATSSSAGVIIVRFNVVMSQEGQDVYKMDTAFGFFPTEAMVNQVGLPMSDEHRAWLEKESGFSVDLRERPEPYCGAAPRLAGPKLLMLDRVTGYWPEEGKAGLGRMRAEKDVDPNEWFFKAHFFQDPVQPGSLGIEAMVQLLQFYMLHTGMAADVPHPRFEPVALDRAMTWKYRGQVVPTNEVITTELEVVEVGRDERGPYAVGELSLWVDGKRIYSAVDMGMRIVPGDPTASPDVTEEPEEEVLDPATDAWLSDHCPTWTLPALPFMSMADRLAAAALRGHAQGGETLRVVGFEDVEVERWAGFPGGPRRFKTEVTDESERDGEIAGRVRLLAWRDAPRSELSRFEPVASGTVILAASYGEAPTALDPLDAPVAPDPYASGALFHGPAFQLLRELRLAVNGSSSVLDATAGEDIPFGVLNQGLLDAATHGIPHDAMHQWSNEIPNDVAAYPQRLLTGRFFTPPPVSGEVRCEARFEGMTAEGPITRLQLIAGGRVWAHLRLREVLMPKGRLGFAPPAERRAFLRDHQVVDGLGLSRFGGERTHLAPGDVAACDWLPGTVARVYSVDDGDRDAFLRGVAVRDHVAQRVGVHPATVRVDLDPDDPTTASAVPERLPLSRFPVTVTRVGDEIVVSDRGEEYLDVVPLRDYWRDYFQTGPWPTEDVYYGLIERFVRRVVLTDPEAWKAIYGRPVLFLANHQVGVESLLFSTVGSGLLGMPTVTLAKDEHRTSWLGRLIALCFSYPGIEDPEAITFFERDNIRSLPPLIRQLSQRIASGERAVMVHSEGTRSLSCRTPVEVLSNSFVDMALKADAPVVPVRFVGGLPAEPLEKRIEFPLGYGKQDYYFGRPLLPEELKEMRYKERRSAVVEAMNATGPPNSEETPFAGDLDFGVEVEEWIAKTGASPEHAVIYKTLEKLVHPVPATEQLVAGARTGELSVKDDEAGRWLAELAGRLYGARGPRVEVEER